MASKWDSRKGQFPRRPAGDDAFVAKVDAAKELYKLYPLTMLADEHVQLKGCKDEHEAAVSELNVKMEAVAQVLLERLEAQDLSAAETSTGQKVGIKTDIYPSITDPQAFEKHINENPGLRYIYKPHPASLAALVRDMLEKGLDAQLPKGLSIFFKTTVGVRK